MPRLPPILPRKRSVAATNKGLLDRHVLHFHITIPRSQSQATIEARSQSLGIRGQGMRAEVDPEQGLTESGDLGPGNDEPGDRPFQARQQKNFRKSPYTFPLSRMTRANHRVRRFRHRSRGSSRSAAWAGVTFPMYDT